VREAKENAEEAKVLEVSQRKATTNAMYAMFKRDVRSGFC
jgi:hypothetical protein